MGKFLDINGVKYLWSKIKEKFLMIGGGNLTDAQKKTTRESIGLPEYVTFSNITDLNNAPSTEVLYAFYTGPKSVNLNSVIKVNSKWHNIDFNGAVVSLGSLPSVNGTNAFEGHGQCFISNLKILGSWNVDESSVNNVLYTFAGVDNVIIDVAMEGSHYGRGFYSCQRLNNCKCEIYGGKITSARAYYYCEYLNSCRVGSKSLSSGFNTCTNLNQCDVYQGGCVGYEFEECKNYTNVSYYVDGVRKYFSDCDNVKVNGYNITNFANLIAKSNHAVTSKVLVHPSGGTGVAEISLDTEATNGSVVRRTTNGGIKVYDGHYEEWACTVKYMQEYAKNLALANTEIDTIFN